MNRLTLPTLRRFVPIIKLVIAIAVAVGLFVAVRSAMSQWNEQTQKIQVQLADLDRQIESADSSRRVQIEAQRSVVEASIPSLANLSYRGILLAALLYACGLVPSAFVLRSALTTMGESPRVSTCIAGQLLGHAGKYVPGKAIVVVLRAGALMRDGVRPLPATVSVFMETLLMMSVGAALSGAIIIGLPAPAWMTWTAATIAIAASIPTIPPVMRWVVAKVSTTDKDGLARINRRLSGRFFLLVWGWSLLSWGLIGAAFTVLVLSIPSAQTMPPTVSLLANATAAIGLAMVIGFASLLPGGAGIRELVLTTLLATCVGAAHAMLSAVAARLLFIIVEAIAAMAAWLWLRRNQPPMTIRWNR